MKESYVFYQSFYEALKELPDDLRLSMYDAISAYALTGEMPDFKGMEKAVFFLIKPQLDANHQRYENGCRGGAPGGNQNARKTTKNNQETTEEQPKNNQKQPKNNQKQPNENDNVNVNVNENVYNTPLFIPPLYGGEKEKTDEEIFFEKYPRYAGGKAKRKGIDYKVLLDEFEKSTYLRSLYTFKQVVAVYDAIVRGEFRDKEKVVSVVDQRADRERWYSQRRAAAENVADANRETVRKRFKRFVDLETEHKAITLEIAKREYAFDKSQDGYAAERLEEATSARDRIEENMAKYIKECGFTVEDLSPKWHCKKCQDTGWQADGKACDCYGKEKEA